MFKCLHTRLIREKRTFTHDIIYRDIILPNHKDIMQWKFLQNNNNNKKKKDKCVFVHTVRKIIYTNYVEAVFHRERQGNARREGGQGRSAS